MALYNNTESLLGLLASLTERDSTLIQVKLNNYLSKAVSARLVFLAIVSQDEEDLHVHVLGEHCLPARVKISVTTPCFDRALSSKEPTTLENLDAKQQTDLFKILYLLHSPAHLAASRQTARSLSTSGFSGHTTGARRAGSSSGLISSGTNTPSTVTPTSGVPAASSGTTISGEDSSSGASGSKNFAATSSSPAKGQQLDKQQRVNSDSSSPLCPSDSSREMEHSATGPSSCSSETDRVLDTSIPIAHEALLTDNVFFSPTLCEGRQRRADRLSLVESACNSFNVRYVKPESFLCVPLFNPDVRPSRKTNLQPCGTSSEPTTQEESSTVLLACCIDKISTNIDTSKMRSKRKSGEHGSTDSPPLSPTAEGLKESELDFDEQDVECIREFFRYALPVLLTTLAYEAERRQRTNCQTMLEVAQNLFARLEDVSSLLQEIMSEARSLTDAERCSLFLLDEDKKQLVAKVFDGQTNDGSSESEVRLPISSGIAGQVASTGTLLNIRDAYTHPLFYRGFDDKTGFRTRNILCFPIKAGEEQLVIGVAELCNKTTGRFFTQFDEQLATSFSVFCGIAITHSLLFNKVSDAHARIRLSNELMMLHMNVTKEEVDKLTNMDVPAPSALHPDFFAYSFFPRLLPEVSTPLAVISMMTHLGIPQRWSIPAHTMARFVMMVRKGYRDPPYHNWVHAFSVTHFAFLLIDNLRLCQTGAISEMEALALMISCMCHDLDHRGTTNSFQVDSNSVLASLYSSEGSVMERHHLAQAMCILNTESCNILENLSKEEYTQCLDLIRDIILATDLAHHLRLLGELKEMATNGYDSTIPRHRHLFICLIMTSADLSDQTKDWDSSRQVAKLIYKEFFTQGDLEKAMGNNPLVMMDREKAFIPELQLSFLDNIALPVYKLVADLFPAASAPYESVLDCRQRWTNVRDSHIHRHSSFTSSLDIFDEELYSA
uniref:Phosphodiesterase n=1 Tax=Hirondellea gigas TaxID=1518452 RepID=A0A6A7FW97_9CRUS